VAANADTVGAELHAGATLALLRVPGRHLAEAHTPLDDVLGSVTEAWCDQLHALPSAAARAQRFAALLEHQLSEHTLHPVARHAIARLSGTSGAVSVSTLVAESGYSHRRFLTLFEEATGITPKRFALVVRFHHTLEAMQQRAPAPTSLGTLAAALGYADQAHLTREFREYTGITPARYQASPPGQLFHLPLREAPEFNFLQDA